MSSLPPRGAANDPLKYQVMWVCKGVTQYFEQGSTYAQASKRMNQFIDKQQKHNDGRVVGAWSVQPWNPVNI